MQKEKREKTKGALKRALALALAAAGIGCIFTACANSAKEDAAESAAKTTAASISGSVSTNGSTSMEEVIGTLSESFMKANPGVNVTYDATGSGSGIEAVGNGTADIGLASRDLKDEEKSSGLEQKTIALDGIAIIVNKDNPASDLTVEQIAQAYTGKIKNWKDLGGNDSAISCVGREAGSGTRDGFETITDTKDSCKMDQELTSTGAVIEAVKSNPNAIGYASFSAVEGQDGIKALTVGGVACKEETIEDGSYKIQRNFNLITKKGTKLTSQAQAFYDYCTSKEQTELIEQSGVVAAVKG